MLQTLVALAEPSRFRIVEFLRDGPRPVNDIVEALAINQPQVSKHLRVLRDAGVVDVRPRAQQRVYELSGERLRELFGWVASYRAVWEARFDAMDEVIAELRAKENRHGRKKRRSS